MAIRSFKGLRVWQESIELIDEIYRLSRTFPRSETYGLASQIQRAAVSVAANIAEGAGRESTREYLHHLAIALGSLAEVETYVVIIARLGYVNPSTTAKLETQCDAIGKMLRNLQKALRKRLDDDKESPGN
jgi:four helix bundle protein